MITFITPSIGRPSLITTVESLITQYNPDWKALVGLDFVMPSFHLPDDPRVSYLMMPHRMGGWGGGHGLAGVVRNYLIHRSPTDWVGFVDDDDKLVADYVDVFKSYTEENPDLDFLVFRMRKNGELYPPSDYGNRIESCRVGISFAVKRSVLETKGIWFANHETEDFHILNALVHAGCKYVVTTECTYQVG